MDELKACPFCGKEMSEDNFFSCDGYPKACGCWEKTHSAQEAVAVWNTRPLEDALRAEVARLTAENSKLDAMVDKASFDRWLINKLENNKGLQKGYAKAIIRDKAYFEIIEKLDTELSAERERNRWVTKGCNGCMYDGYQFISNECGECKRGCLDMSDKWRHCDPRKAK